MSEKKLLITIDGDAATGKGTLSRALARHLKMPYLDSGALYRTVGWTCLKGELDVNDSVQLNSFCRSMQLSFDLQNDHDFAPPAIVKYKGEDISQHIRTEVVAQTSSIISQNSEVRSHLLSLQRSFVNAAGLIADGRDMGTVVFPEAMLKIFLIARDDVRHQRRINEEINSNQYSKDKISRLTNNLRTRDQRDRNRKSSPAIPAEDAIIIDSSDKTPQVVFDCVLEHWSKRIKNL